MRIRGGSLEMGRQMRVGSSKMAIFASFARFCHPKCHTQGHYYYYIVICSPFVLFTDTEMDDLKLTRMAILC